MYLVPLALKRVVYLLQDAVTGRNTLNANRSYAPLKFAAAILHNLSHLVNYIIYLRPLLPDGARIALKIYQLRFIHVYYLHSITDAPLCLQQSHLHVGNTVLYLA